MYGQRQTSRPIYGIKRPGPCIMKVPADKDINTYLTSLDQVLSALEMYNNKAASIESIQIIENRINTALGVGSTAS